MKRPCRFFFERGRCLKGDACDFSHTKGPSQPPPVPRATNANPIQASAPAPPATLALKTDPPYPSLSAVTATDSDGLVFPTRVQPFKISNAIIFAAKREGKPIKDAGSAERFIGAIVQSNVHNSGWSFDDRQAILSDLSDTSNHAPARLAEVLAFSRVSSKGDAATTLPFQSYIGLIAYFTSTSILRSAALSCINSLFGVVELNIDAILKTLKTNITNCVASKTFFDGLTGRYGYAYVNRETVKLVTGAQVFKPAASFLIEYVNRFRTAPTTHPGLQVFATFLSEKFEEWAVALEKPGGNFRDQLSSQSAADKKAVLASIRTTIFLLEETVAQALPKEQASSKTGLISGPSKGLMAAIDREYDGPGELSADGPRHDNGEKQLRLQLTTDHKDIHDITVPPTAQEMVAPRGSYMPANVPGARHHLPGDSMSKILDVQFRLLRADMTGGLQQGVKAIVADLMSPDYRYTELAKCLRGRSGWYVDDAATRDTVRLPVLANLEFVDLSLDNRHGLVVETTADAPPGHRARSKNIKVRSEHWAQSKRMPQGGLVAIVTQHGNGDPHIAMAILTTYSANFKHLKCKGEEAPRFQFGLHFVDPADGLQAAQILQQGEAKSFNTRFLIESPSLFESFRPFLVSLQKLEPLRIPLQEYLVHRDLDNVNVALPQYAMSSSFTWDLSTLLKEDTEAKDCVLDPRDELSIASAREVMHSASKLDPSDAVIDSLVRSLNLVQGPPGTGKTFTGVELLRVLFANKAGPVLLLAYTNHALDHILRAVHDAGVTRNIVRLGTRSKDEVISQYNLEVINRVVQTRNKLGMLVNHSYRAMKDIDEVSNTEDYANSQELNRLIKSMVSGVLTTEKLFSYLEACYPSILDSVSCAPEYIQALFEGQRDSGFVTVGLKTLDPEEFTLWDYWKSGQDVTHIKSLQKEEDKSKRRVKEFVPDSRFDLPQAMPSKRKNKKPSSAEAEDPTLMYQASYGFVFDMVDGDLSDYSSDDSEEEGDDEDNLFARPPAESDSDLDLEDLATTMAQDARIDADDVGQRRQAFLSEFSLECLPSIATSSRDIDALLADGNVWSFSRDERRRLSQLIEVEAKRCLDEESIAQFEALTARHDAARIRLEEANDNVRLSLLSRIELVGATSTGAAKLGGVLQGWAPKILVIEEAGQVLEAHVIANLVPSIEHVIAIGDPLQLRPSVSTYELTMDNRSGKDLYRFDMSLMERLSQAGLPMSQLQVQRRMTPAVSSLIRNTLYPNLEDHELVTEYPDVVGMHRNVFWLDHRHKESGGGESGSSKTNNYEAQMACDLALYLLKQGPYKTEGDIVILCAYLGQLRLVSDILKSSGTVEVIIDERDRDNLVKTIGEDEEHAADLIPSAVARSVNLDKQILIRTVDNFQGEEAKIVILSLVRNAGGKELDAAAKPTIGFLRSNNRSNVALSRAQHGMYILGNADQLAAASEMWRSVVSDLSEQNAIGPGMPIACAKHGKVIYVDRPGMISLVSPDGGCDQPCNANLPACGHKCMRKCHPDDPEHKNFPCRERCSRIHSTCDHPCERRCFEKCGNCMVVRKDVELPCGHTADVLCYQMQNLAIVRCKTKVRKDLPTCEHSTMVACSQDELWDIKCRETCNGDLKCCSKTCSGRCGDCQTLTGRVRPHDENFVKIARTQHSQHPCLKPVPTCGHLCQHPCGSNHGHSTTTCLGDCLRVCTHSACDLPCNVACSPCQQSCDWTCKHRSCQLPCGMPCDRVPCDEPCTRTLACGHPCSSICGEPCDIQVCTTCATDDQLAQLSDLVMQATLREAVEDDPLVRLITLECGHIFTVETLDGTLDLTKYYDKDSVSGQWTGLLTPDGFQERVTCPVCRGSVTSPRYNRPTKRAMLDIQERVALERYTAEVQQATAELARPEPEDPAARVRMAINNVNYTGAGSFQPKVMMNTLSALAPNDDQCISPSYFECGISGFFGIEGTWGRVWQKLAGRTLALYRHMADIVNTHRMPHNLAYEGAVSSIYWQELEVARKSKTVELCDPKQAALLTSRRRIGAPPPGSEKRFKVEALHQTIYARLKMFKLAKALSDEICKRVNSAPPAPKKGKKAQRNAHNTAHRLSRSFNGMAVGLLVSAKRDVQLAIRLAENYKLPRLVVESRLLGLLVSFEDIRFTVKGAIQAAENSSQRADGPSCNEVAKSEERRCRKTLTEESDSYNKAIGYLRRGMLGLKLKDEEKEVVLRHIADARPQADAIFDEWKEFAKTIRSGKWYEPVSLNEKRAVIAAILETEWGTSGRFYQCPNGHPFVIGDCGQATREARCLECGATVGGASHRLRADNTRDDELEQIAGEVGGRANPFINWVG